MTRIDAFFEAYQRLYDAPHSRYQRQVNVFFKMLYDYARALSVVYFRDRYSPSMRDDAVSHAVQSLFTLYAQKRHVFDHAGHFVRYTRTALVQYQRQWFFTEATQHPDENHVSFETLRQHPARPNEASELELYFQQLRRAVFRIVVRNCPYQDIARIVYVYACATLLYLVGFDVDAAFTFGGYHKEGLILSYHDIVEHARSSVQSTLYRFLDTESVEWL